MERSGDIAERDEWGVVGSTRGGSAMFLFPGTGGSQDSDVPAELHVSAVWILGVETVVEWRGAVSESRCRRAGSNADHVRTCVHAVTTYEM